MVKDPLQTEFQELSKETLINLTTRFTYPSNKEVNFVKLSKFFDKVSKEKAWHVIGEGYPVLSLDEREPTTIHLVVPHNDEQYRWWKIFGHIPAIWTVENLSDEEIVHQAFLSTIINQENLTYHNLCTILAFNNVKKFPYDGYHSVRNRNGNITELKYHVQSLSALQIAHASGEEFYGKYIRKISSVETFTPEALEKSQVHSKTVPVHKQLTELARLHMDYIEDRNKCPIPLSTMVSLVKTHLMSPELALVPRFVHQADDSKLCMILPNNEEQAIWWTHVGGLPAVDYRRFGSLEQVLKYSVLKDVKCADDITLSHFKLLDVYLNPNRSYPFIIEGENDHGKYTINLQSANMMDYSPADAGLDYCNVTFPLATKFTPNKKQEQEDMNKDIIVTMASNLITQVIHGHTVDAQEWLSKIRTKYASMNDTNELAGIPQFVSTEVDGKHHCIVLPTTEEEVDWWMATEGMWVQVFDKLPEREEIVKASVLGHIRSKDEIKPALMKLIDVFCNPDRKYPHVGSYDNGNVIIHYSILTRSSLDFTVGNHVQYPFENFRSTFLDVEPSIPAGRVTNGDELVYSKPELDAKINATVEVPDEAPSALDEVSNLITQSIKEHAEETLGERITMATTQDGKYAVELFKEFNSKAEAKDFMTKVLDLM